MTGSRRTQKGTRASAVHLRSGPSGGCPAAIVETPSGLDAM